MVDAVTITQGEDDVTISSSAGTQGQPGQAGATGPQGPAGAPGVFVKNYIINGAMMISQENGTTAGTTQIYYAVDCFRTGGANGGTFTFAQIASTSLGGSPNRLRLTVTAADAAVAAGDLQLITTSLEGLRVADLLFGSASAKTFILRFGVKAPAGTYCVAFQNSAADRSYIGEYVISAGEANTAVVKSITVPGDVTGTWLTNANVGMNIWWSLMTGSTYQTAAGAWSAGTKYASSNQFNLLGTNSNIFELFDVGLYVGSVAPDFQVPEYAIELILCRRYYAKYYSNYIQSSIATGAGQVCYANYQFDTRMRAIPTVSGTASGGNSSAPSYGPSLDGCRVDITSAAAGVFYMTIDPFIFNARL